MISGALICILGYLLAKAYQHRERKTVSQDWLLHHQRREWAKGMPDQVCWTWPFKGWR